jgi:hypothetical protein
MTTIQQAQDYVSSVGIKEAKQSTHYLIGKTCECDACFCCRVWETVNAKQAQAQARKARNQAYADLGLVKVRGALGGTYWDKTFPSQYPHPNRMGFFVVPFARCPFL